MNYWGPFKTFELHFVQSHLRSGEKILYRTRLSRALLAAPLLLFVIAGSLLLLSLFASLIVLCLACASVVFLFPVYFVSEMAVTNNRFLAQVFNTTIKLGFHEVTRVKVFQSPLGAFLGYGTVAITWASMPPQPIYLRWVCQPHELGEHIEAGIAAAAAAKTPPG